MVAACVLSVLAGAQEERAEFEARLADAQRALAARKYAEAERVVLAAVAAQPGQEFVLYDWFEVEDLLAEAAFWKDYDPPEPADVVHGELLSWDAASCKIRIRYRHAKGELVVPKKESDTGPAKDEDAEERAGDFYLSDEFLLHPAVFKGPYSVELEGKALDPRTPLPLVLVAWRWDSLRGFEYGEAYGVGFGDLSGIYRIAGGEVRSVTSSTNMIRYGRPYSFKVSVGKANLNLLINGKIACKSDREAGEYGQLGFQGFDGLDEVLITGEIEPSWITGLVDERVQRDQRAFRERFDPFAKLPEWLKERVAGAEERARDYDECAPRPPGPKDAGACKAVDDLLDEGKLEKALAHARALATPDVSAGCKDWLLARLLRLQGRYAEALEHGLRVCAADPSFYEARLLCARLRQGLGKPADAVRALEELALAFPHYLDTYEDLVQLALDRGDPDAARLAIEAAVDAGVSPRALLRAGRTLRRSQHGPSFGASWTWDTKHYVVTSNLSKEASYQLATELEEFHQKYVIHVRRPKEAPAGKARVYFFAGHAGYLAYTGDLLGDPAEGTLGLYSPWLKQLVLWNSPDKRMVMRTARHEGFHQYLDQITDHAPVWLNEGMAEYFEQARRVDGQWRDDQLNLDHLAVLRATDDDWTPLEEFVHQEAPGFRVKSGLHYPQAWAFVHFLMSRDAKHGKRMDALLDALFAGATREDALTRAFGGVDWKELESAFRAYVERLR